MKGFLDEVASVLSGYSISAEDARDLAVLAQRRAAEITNMALTAEPGMREAKAIAVEELRLRGLAALQRAAAAGDAQLGGRVVGALETALAFATRIGMNTWGLR